MGLPIDVLRQSFALIVEREPELTRRFYDSLFATYPQAQAMFARTERRNQERMLRDALVAVIDNVDDARWMTAYLTELGARHVAYGVTAEMYDWVGACLLRTLADVGGDQWTPEMAAAWLEAYAAIAATMKMGALKAAAARASSPAVDAIGADRHHRG